MSSIALPIAIFAFGALLVRPMFDDMKRWERSLLWSSYVLHLLAVFAGVAVTRYYYGVGDMLSYHNLGGLIAAHLWSDFGEIAPRLIKLLFQQGGENLVPYGANTPTGSMYAVATMLHTLFGGNLLASCAAISLSSFAAKLAIYRVFRAEIHGRFSKPVLIATMLVPSVIYWSSGLLKESVAITALGLMVWGGHRLGTRRRPVLGAFCLLVGAIGVSLFKPYLLVPFSLGAATWVYVHRGVRWRYHSPLGRQTKMVLTGLGAVGLLFAISALFPRYDFREIQEQVAIEQKYGHDTEGGSNFRLSANTTAGTAEQLATAPLAVATALFRPTILEARSPLALLNSGETLVLSILFLLVLKRRGVRQSLREIRNSSLLSFCAVFTLILALGVGFATTNLGTLSRYRMPLVPFFAVVLVILGERKKRVLPGTWPKVP